MLHDTELGYKWVSWALSDAPQCWVQEKFAGSSASSAQQSPPDWAAPASLKRESSGVTGKGRCSTHQTVVMGLIDPIQLSSGS